MVPLKSEKDLVKLKEAGTILSRITGKLIECAKVGSSTLDLDKAAEKYIKEEGVLPAFKGYKGYPACVCTSLNEEIVHGIPRSDRVLKSGDILSIDIGIKHQGYFSDMAVTIPLGKVEPRLIKLIEVTKEALFQGIKKAACGNHLSDISFAIQSYAEGHGFSVVRQFVGHGIGKELHEEPEVPNFGAGGQGERLREGMVLAIEPMINLGGWECEILDDSWTAVTKDRLASAHFEHTVAVTNSGPQILTAG